jgi:hypothetical protein
MRRSPLALVLTFALAFVTGCAHDVRTTFPAPPEAPTGTLVLLLTQAADVSVAVNGLLVVESEHTEKVTVTNVPTGHVEVTIAANGGDKQFRVWVQSEHPTTVPLGVPAEGNSFLKTLAGTLITIAAYTLLR